MFTLYIYTLSDINLGFIEFYKSSTRYWMSTLCCWCRYFTHFWYF